MSLDTFDSIFQQFPAPTPADWKEKIIKDLKGESFDKLIWHSREGIDVLPFYTNEDSERYQLSIPEKSAKGWMITERIFVQDIVSANQEALKALQAGAGALVFDLQGKSFHKAEIDSLLEGILLEVAPLTFENYTEDDRDMLEAVQKGACPFVVKISEQDTMSDELATALLQGVQYRDKDIRFHFLIGGNYFFEIARLRALRWLWKQVCEISNQPYSIFIQCETDTRSFSIEEENVNMLRNTTEAMSAILGGCDSLIINSHDILTDNSDFGKRIARNVHHILHYESYFNEIEDAAKGSYYIEYLTYQLCKKSWEKFSKS